MAPSSLGKGNEMKPNQLYLNNFFFLMSRSKFHWYILIYILINYSFIYVLMKLWWGNGVELWFHEQMKSSSSSENIPWFDVAWRLIKPTKKMFYLCFWTALRYNLILGKKQNIFKAFLWRRAGKYKWNLMEFQLKIMK